MYMYQDLETHDHPLHVLDISLFCTLATIVKSGKDHPLSKATYVCITQTVKMVFQRAADNKKFP
jgi:putative heme iron utilization protein